MKKLLKKEICGSREQCTGPTGVTYSVQNLHFQRGSGSHAWDPLAGLSLPHSRASQIIKKIKAKRENVDKKDYPNTHLIKFCQLNVPGKVFFPSSLKWNVISPQILREGM